MGHKQMLFHAPVSIASILLLTEATTKADQFHGNVVVTAAPGFSVKQLPIPAAISSTVKVLNLRARVLSLQSMLSESIDSSAIA